VPLPRFPPLEVCGRRPRSAPRHRHGAGIRKPSQQQTSRALNVHGEQVPPAWKALEFMRTSLCELQARACNQLGNNS